MPTSEKGLQFAKILSKVKRDFINSLSNLLIYDIFFKIIAVAIFGTVSSWILNRLVSASGSYVIGNTQIVSFILSPIGMLALIISGASALAIIFAEQAGLILIASRVRPGLTIKFREALWLTFKYVRVLFELAIRQVVIYALYLTPFAAIGGVAYLVLTSRHDVNYLLTEMPPAFWIGASITVILAICALLVIGMLYVRWLFSVPFCVLEGEKPAAALRSSRNLVAGNFWRVAIIILGWGFLITAAAGIITFFFGLMSGFILKSLGGNLAAVIAVVGILLSIYALMVAALTFIGFAVNCLLITRLYYDIRGQKGLPVATRPKNDLAGKLAQPSHRKMIWAVAILGLVFATISSFFIIDDIDVDHQVAVTAHRGSSKYAPENTLSAVRRAIEDGADFAEIDVQETADGVIVALHDTDLMKVAGVAKKIWEITYDEIKTLDAGTWFSPDFEGEHIPTLGEMIKVAKGKIKLNIELKFNGHDKHLVESVLKIIQDNDFESHCVISSLNYEGIMKVRDMNPDLKIGYIIAKAIGNMFRADTDFLSLSSSIVTANVTASARKRSKDIHVWTINAPHKMSYFIDLGVDNILTDVPDVLVALIKERASLSDVEKLLLRTGNWLSR